MNKKPNNLGKVLPSGSLILSMAICEIGTDENPEQFSFELANLKAPMITSKKTGKRFILSPTDLVAMAIEAGIEEFDE
ncbi:hypothetical protein [Acinetobacter modestus]|uniref:hypothetical protein n=1 Tax=Acinetobacter modestus TaxID=1776740 RepID=UPI00320845A0